MQYIPIILFAIYSILKAFCDTLWTHFSTSIFKDKDPNKWNPNYSWNHTFTFLGYHCDPLHHAQSVRIICFIIAVILATTSGKLVTGNIYWECVMYTAVYTFFFNIFYSYIFKSK